MKLTALGKACLPGFRFTSNQMSLNYQAKIHVDGSNCGPSYLVALGNYAEGDGGKLWVQGARLDRLGRLVEGLIKEDIATMVVSQAVKGGEEEVAVVGR